MSAFSINKTILKTAIRILFPTFLSLIGISNYAMADLSCNENENCMRRVCFVFCTDVQDPVCQIGKETCRKSKCSALASDADRYIDTAKAAIEAQSRLINETEAQLSRDRSLLLLQEASLKNLNDSVQQTEATRTSFLSNVENTESLKAAIISVIEFANERKIDLTEALHEFKLSKIEFEIIEGLISQANQGQNATDISVNNSTEKLSKLLQDAEINRNSLFEKYFLNQLTIFNNQLVQTRKSIEDTKGYISNGEGKIIISNATIQSQNSYINDQNNRKCH